jgi:hypothetical protein
MAVMSAFDPKRTSADGQTVAALTRSGLEQSLAGQC